MSRTSPIVPGCLRWPASPCDAFITVWDSKWHYSFWRPITAIREGANDGNPLTDGETGWNSMIATPPYPDYTSGANGVTSATMQILRSFFGTNKFVFSVSSVPANKSRVCTSDSRTCRMTSWTRVCGRGFTSASPTKWDGSRVSALRCGCSRTSSSLSSQSKDHGVRPRPRCVGVGGLFSFPPLPFPEYNSHIFALCSTS